MMSGIRKLERRKRKLFLLKNDFLSELDLEYQVENQLVSPKWLVNDRSKDLVIF